MKWLFLNALDRRRLLIASVQGVVFFVLLFLAFSVWVQYFFQGWDWGPLLPTVGWEVPKKLIAKGIDHITDGGWDGQAYYYAANDPFILDDESVRINSPYRYQRIGMPVLAYFLSRLLHLDFTPAWIYYLVEFLAVSLGLIFLLFWLRKNEVGSVYSAAWILGYGTFTSLLHGLQDAPADALFIISLTAIFAERLILYFLAASLLLLTREVYSIFVLTVFIYTALGKLRWGNARIISKLLLTALPGIIFASWAWYVKQRFGTLSAEAGKGALDWPLIGLWVELKAALIAGNQLNAGLILYVFTFMVLITTLLFKHGRKSPALQSTIPYVLFLFGLSWSMYPGFMKASGAVVILGIFLIPRERTFTLNAALLLNAVLGVSLLYYDKVKIQPFYQKLHRPKPVVTSISPKKLQQVRRYLSPTRIDDRWKHRTEFPSWFNLRKTIKPIEIEVINASDRIWSSTEETGSTQLSYQWFDANEKTEITKPQHFPMPMALEPGQKGRFEADIILPPGTGRRILLVSLVAKNISRLYPFTQYGFSRLIIIE
jgi:hypothetical protein